MNSVSLIGRITVDPELKHTQSGLANVRFSIAVDRQFVKQGEERQADFINIVAWKQTAEFVCKYFGKGQKIALTGRIQTSSYTDKDGNKRYTFDVVADNVEFCESKQRSGGTAENERKAENKPADSAHSHSNRTADIGIYQNANDEDLPF